jgi:hypothetical protein
VPKADDIRQAQGRISVRDLWVKVREARDVFEKDPTQFAGLEEAVKAFFDWESKHARRECIRLAEQDKVKVSKMALLEELGRSGVFVLERGALDDYYPPGVVGQDKPSKALSFCNLYKTRDQIVPLSSIRSTPPTGEALTEWETICASIFN